MKPIIASGLLFVGLAIVAMAGDITPDTSLANASNFQIEQEWCFEDEVYPINSAALILRSCRNSWRFGHDKGF
jgi:hypothetical protein